MKWTALTPLEYFASLVHGDTLPLLETVASLAQDDEPRLDLQALVTEMDTLLHRLRQRLPADAGALTRLRMLHHYFYKELGFGGNRNDYYAARNSYLHEVVRTRMGIPVSLAVLWLELARGIQLRADGISFPGHFLLKVRLPDGYVVIDPMNGRSLSPEEIGERLEPMRERLGALSEEELPLALYLQAASSRDIVGRMLRNLKEIHRSNEDWGRLVAVQDRMLVLHPEGWSEWRDRGYAHAQIGNTVQAVQDLETYLAHAAHAGDVEEVTRLVAQLRGASGTGAERRPD
ncbi:MAG: transglutaminase [Burkholderiales bacterium 66-5]|uniref:SirB1 family protein n=1 Tax=Comamonas badia TaxID=265291 RepID=UPI00040792A2|nr:tetratricopeptide repeat protein [Comamonas badia]OJU92528.1 MAG: transglutaminase [Burkholderiales bacterium 66-5]